MGIFDIFRRRTPDDFAKRVMARLTKRGWPHATSYDRKRFEIRLGGDRRMYLGNTYRDWLTYPADERDSAIDLAIAHVLEEKDDLDFEAAQGLLLPVVRSRFDIAAISEGEAPLAKVPTRPLAGPICVLAAIDRPHSMLFVNEQTLAEWGESFDEVLARAIQNLEAQGACEFERDDSGFWVSRCADYYDPSRLLTPVLFEQLELRGAPVAIAISRSCLVVAGSEDIEALDAMAEFASRAVPDETRPISYSPLILRGDQWDEFRPEGAGFAAVRRLSVQQRLWDYAKQQSVLQEERSPRDVYVASADGRERDGELETWSTWTEGVPTLLPRTDYIGITDLRLYIFRRWEDVETVCGPFDVEEGHDPVRYFVDRWPGEAAIARLKAEFDPPAWGPD